MKRQIIKINEEKCSGCGLCARACHEGAIAVINGKAKLIRDDYCDGMGDCLPECPTGAISFEEREAAAYDAQAVLERKTQLEGAAHEVDMIADETASELKNWPVQIKLAPLKAAYYDGADLLIAADCTAYAYCAFHRDFIRGKVTLIGCPKLDAVDYSEKLAAVIRQNAIGSITVVRMEVPCCGGLELAVKRALLASGKLIPYNVTVISSKGVIINR